MYAFELCKVAEIFVDKQPRKSKMKRTLVPVFLLLLLLLLLKVIFPVSSLEATVHVVSYRKLETYNYGPVRCALDLANETIPSSSQYDCTLRCTRDVACSGFNVKNSLTCDLYNNKPKLTAPVSDCMFYQVVII